MNWLLRIIYSEFLISKYEYVTFLTYFLSLFVKEKMNKVLYIILISLFSLTILSCAKSSDDSSSSTTELEGTWVESCHAVGSYFRINSLTV